MRRYKVAIVEPATLVAEGIATIVGGSHEGEIVGLVRNTTELEQLLRNTEVDVIIAAAALHRDLKACAAIEEIPVVGVLSSLIDDEATRKFASTASIYTSAEELLRIVRRAVDAPTEHNYAESHELSERERDVLILVAKGYTNKEIASELNISPHTVISHRKNIVHKTGIRSVAGLTVYAVLNNLIDSEQL
ncbi:MAG: response regulator transcription factor [Alistipes sp.]|nr:response regulator transcription factor [Alistipes sp.]